MFLVFKRGGGGGREKNEFDSKKKSASSGGGAKFYEGEHIFNILDINILYLKNIG
jgi:hypothetical protein